MSDELHTCCRCYEEKDTEDMFNVQEKICQKCHENRYDYWVSSSLLPKGWEVEGYDYDD